MYVFLIYINLAICNVIALIINRICLIVVFNLNELCHDYHVNPLYSYKNEVNCMNV